MHIIESKYNGFCYGVENALKILKETLNKYNFVSLSHKICHNTYVEKKINVSVYNDDLKPDALVISAHGASRAFKDNIKKKGITVIDATCPVVACKISSIEKTDGILIYVGQKGHAEMTASTSSYNGKVYCISSLKEAIDFSQFKNDIKHAYIAVQSSFSDTMFNDIKDILSKKIKLTLIGGEICPDCLRRRTEAQRLSLCAKNVLIVGDVISTNANELLNIANKNCPSFLVLDDNFSNLNFSDVVGVISSSSSPNELFLSVVDRLRNYKS